MLVNSEFADEIEHLSVKMQTSPNDVIATAIELLKIALSREVTIHKKDSNVEVKIPFFKSFEPEVKVDGE